MTTLKLLIVRFAGCVLVLVGVLGFFFLVNPATSGRMSKWSVVFYALAVGLGIGMLLIRKWAAGVFLVSALCAGAFVVRESFRPDVGWSIYMNVALLAIPAWACVSAWRSLK
jgi:hypothetical protein